MSTTTAPIGDFCSRCYSFPCVCYSPPPPQAVKWDRTGEIIAALERIAAALERLADEPRTSQGVEE